MECNRKIPLKMLTITGRLHCALHLQPATWTVVLSIPPRSILHQMKWSSCKATRRMEWAVQSHMRYVISLMLRKHWGFLRQAGGSQSKLPDSKCLSPNWTTPARNSDWDLPLKGKIAIHLGPFVKPKTLWWLNQLQKIWSGIKVQIIKFSNN